jgi:hypothetical protein
MRENLAAPTLREARKDGRAPAIKFCVTVVDSAQKQTIKAWVAPKLLAEIECQDSRYHANR